MRTIRKAAEDLALAPLYLRVVLIRSSLELLRCLDFCLKRATNCRCLLEGVDKWAVAIMVASQRYQPTHAQRPQILFYISTTRAPRNQRSVLGLICSQSAFSAEVVQCEILQGLLPLRAQMFARTSTMKCFSMSTMYIYRQYIHIYMCISICSYLHFCCYLYTRL